MIPVAEALRRLLDGLEPVGVEEVGVAEALGRVLAEDVRARVTQPPWPVSAMDGYAVRAADVATVPARLKVVGAIPAGASFAGAVGEREAVRIFTGAPLPTGADAIVIQEDTKREGEAVVVGESAPKGRYVRPAGLDFRAGEIGLAAGRVMSARDVGLAAAMNVPWLRVRRRPQVAILATGDEVVRPGDPLGPNQIVSSNGFALAALIAALGAMPISLGIAADTIESLVDRAAHAAGADLLITTGGASVGDHDLVQQALGQKGLAVDFWKIAMRPGKPLMWGRMGRVPVLGLPGNPVSTLVCSLVFLKPALDRLMGLKETAQPTATARLTRALPANDRRQDYLRSTLAHGDGGALLVTPFEKQDSSMLSLMVRADCLVVRPPLDPTLVAGAAVEILTFPSGRAGF
ncbi:MAG: molybdopterin molybdotransferase MoeA [Proteobacteria bacterium]|nr:molybdopterin molybdotransferase MoeA [Pseudomonadota bacterium]MBI3496914.1 molybdopterin molybdotransferase MoeA [Pseudomonadota bacterium]